MDPKTEQYFRDLNDMFRSAGWKLLIEDVQIQKDNLDRVSTVQSEKELFDRQGQLRILESILNLEAGIELAYKDAEQEDAEGI